MGKEKCGKWWTGGTFAGGAEVEAILDRTVAEEGVGNVGGKGAVADAVPFRRPKHPIPELQRSVNLTILVRLGTRWRSMARRFRGNVLIRTKGSKAANLD